MERDSGRDKTCRRILMRKYSIYILIHILMIFGIASAVYAASVREEYELQEKCGKRCEEIFKKENQFVKTTSDGQMLSGYQNHYNKKLNKCFILIETTNYPNDKKTDILYMKWIFDVNENKEYGSVNKFRKNPSVSGCYVLERTCTSVREWDLLVKPYMEE